MPSFEHSVSNQRGGDSTGAYSYSKILSIFKPKTGDDDSAFARSGRATVTLKDDIGYDRVLREMKEDEYKNVAGSDLSAIFMPYEAKLKNPNLAIPGFHSGVAVKDYLKIETLRLTPFQWEPSETGYITDRWSAPSGDSLNNLVSSDKYYADPHQYRDMSNMRGVGIRLPMMAVGWGFTVEGDPWPSGEAKSGMVAGVHYPSGAKFFKGGKLDGTEIDPSDYVAAPVDLRYDVARHVWTASPELGFWATIASYLPIWVARPVSFDFEGQSNPKGSGLAWSWREVEVGISGQMRTKFNGRFGVYNFTSQIWEGLGPAFEVRNVNPLPDAAIIWIVPSKGVDGKNYYMFSWHLPPARRRFEVLTTLDDMGVIGWSYPRFH